MRKWHLIGVWSPAAYRVARDRVSPGSEEEGPHRLASRSGGTRALRADDLKRSGLVAEPLIEEHAEEISFVPAQCDMHAAKGDERHDSPSL